MNDNKPDENGFKLTDALRQSPRSATDEDVLDLCDIIDRRDAEIERLKQVHVSNSVLALTRSLDHAIHSGFLTQTYDCKYNDVVACMFPQLWGSTTLGFGGIGGAAITTAYTVIVESNLGCGYCVYFGGSFAYRIERPNDTFFDDMKNRSMVSVRNGVSKYERKAQ